MRVPSPGGLSTPKRPPTVSMRSASPSRPEPRADVRAADAVVDDLDPHDAVDRRQAHVARCDACAYFATFVSDSETT